MTSMTTPTRVGKADPTWQSNPRVEHLQLRTAAHRRPAPDTPAGGSHDASFPWQGSPAAPLTATYGSRVRFTRHAYVRGGESGRCGRASPPCMGDVAGVCSQ